MSLARSPTRRCAARIGRDKALGEVPFACPLLANASMTAPGAELALAGDELRSATENVMADPALSEAVLTPLR